jgi:hypothetical protein
MNESWWGQGYSEFAIKHNEIKRGFTSLLDTAHTENYIRPLEEVHIHFRRGGWHPF